VQKILIMEVIVPDIGDFKEVPVMEVMVRPGDVVKPDDALITLESDKATIDVPAPFGGTVRELRVKIGDRVSEGTPILELEVPDRPIASVLAIDSPVRGQTSPEAPALPSDVPASPLVSAGLRMPDTPTVSADERGASLPHASPAIRRFARELGVSLDRVAGTGPGSRILKQDVHSFVKSALARLGAEGMSDPAGGTGGSLSHPTGFVRFAGVWRPPLHQATKPQSTDLQRSGSPISQGSHFDEADITGLDAFCKELGDKAAQHGSEVVLLAFLLKVSVAALKQQPMFNAWLDGEDLVLERHYHLGFVAQGQNGLVVPVVRDVDQKGVLQIAQEIGDLSALARAGNLRAEDIQGATFTVSSLGSTGGNGVAPAINAPEVAMLGIARSARRLMEIDGRFIPRVILPLALSYDLRVIDSAAAVRFAGCMAAMLGDVRRAVI
jgi:pyruvate dehydrogenase E2 component (dihydrolipoamide acetyltransferase)